MKYLSNKIEPQNKYDFFFKVWTGCNNGYNFGSNTYLKSHAIHEGGVSTSDILFQQSQTPWPPKRDLTSFSTQVLSLPPWQIKSIGEYNIYRYIIFNCTWKFILQLRLARYRVVVLYTPSRHCEGMEIFYQDPTHFTVEAYKKHGMKVVNFQLAMEDRRWFIVGCYLVPDNASSIENIVWNTAHRPW